MTNLCGYTSPNMQSPSGNAERFQLTINDEVVAAAVDVLTAFTSHTFQFTATSQGDAEVKIRNVSPHLTNRDGHSVFLDGFVSCTSRRHHSCRRLYWEQQWLRVGVWNSGECDSVYEITRRLCCASVRVWRLFLGSQVGTWLWL